MSHLRLPLRVERVTLYDPAGFPERDLYRIFGADEQYQKDTPVADMVFTGSPEYLKAKEIVDAVNSRADLVDVMAQAHVVKGVLRHIQQWAEDPVYADPIQRAIELKRALEAVDKLHESLSAALNP